MTTILNELKEKYRNWKKQKNEEGKVYRDALHEAKLEELKKKAVIDAHEQVFVKKKKDINSPINGFINDLGAGNGTNKTKNMYKTDYLSEEIFGPNKNVIKDKNNNSDKYNWRF